jgi:hypothetical protein
MTETERQLADGRGMGGGVKSYDCEKAWSSINHAILSEYSLIKCKMHTPTMAPQYSSGVAALMNVYNGQYIHKRTWS